MRRPGRAALRRSPGAEAGAGEALVKIAAVGMNFIDVQHREGRYKAARLPFTVGSEAAGTVTAVGPDVTEVPSAIASPTRW